LVRDVAAHETNPELFNDMKALTFESGGSMRPRASRQVGAPSCQAGTAASPGWTTSRS
jgi:hypothetical protein